ncbi:MAG: hypothetical protein U1E45_14820 [Geminicoccaceae bacterium]
MSTYCFWTSDAGETVSVRHDLVDGAHFFTSTAVPGLCAAHQDARTAFAAVAPQLGMIMSRRCGRPVTFNPDAAALTLLVELVACPPGRPTSLH